MSAYEIGKAVIVGMFVIGAAYEAFARSTSILMRVFRIAQLGAIAAVLAWAL